ncbi:hypothetical protein IAU60_005061 [Kwoniella sp. DSM 27419]
MGKKKRTQVFVLKPWCWYLLLQHQKSKHFKCQLCPRKLNTAGGLMVHSQQVHKCEPEPLTNTLPGRDGYDIEIFGMEGVPTNALAEWKARKEAEHGTAALAAANGANRIRHSYNVIPEADLQAALAQHKALMAHRNKPASVVPFPGYQGALPPFPPGMPPGFPGMPPPTMGLPGVPPFAPPFPPNGVPPFASAGTSPFPVGTPAPPTNGNAPIPDQLPGSSTPAPGTKVEVQLPVDGVMWPDVSASPPRYRYTSPTPDGGDSVSGVGQKRKAAADFL